MEESKVWILESLTIAFLVIQVTILFFYHGYSSIPQCTPELTSRSNMYLLVFTLSGIASFSSALYLKREKTLLTELLIFIVGMFVILTESFCVS